MIARALPWFEDEDPRDLARWSIAAAAVVGIHAVVIAGYLLWHQPDGELGDDASIISIEMTAAQIDQQEQTKVDTPTPPKETSPDAVLPEEKPPDVVEQTNPAPRTTVQELASAPRIDSSWRSLLFKRLQQTKSYPAKARQRNEQGVVLMAFSVDRNGHVLSRRIVNSSGYPDLDAEAMAWIERAQPMPAFPASMTEPEIDDLTVPLRFSLQ